MGMRWMNRVFVTAIAAFSPYATAQWAMPTSGPLATVPMILKSAVPPNVLFALSVEYPTANTAAYQDANGYSASKTYLGYFDAAKCYDYDVTNQWFYPSAMATAHACASNDWSGNFLNWATMTGLDEFRFAMTGGNRYVDTASVTVLQRTYQSGQGGTGNFTDKTYSGTGATPYPSSNTLTIQNQGQGTRMKVSTGSLSSSVSCSGPQISNGSFGCTALTLNDTFGSTGSCTTWTGSGTSALPYKCAAFGNFSNGETISSVNSTTSTQVVSSTSDTVNCTGPTLGSPFSCTLTAASNGGLGSCSSWVGNGTAGSPYACATFGTFAGGMSIASSTPNAATSTALSGTGSISCSSATVSGSGTFSCTPMLNGDTSTCNSPTGLGTNSSPYRCSSFGAFSGGEAVTSFANGTKTTLTATVPTASCGVSGSTITCTLPNGDTASCKTQKGSGTAGSPYYCQAFNNFSGGEQTTASSPSNPTLVSSKYYDLAYSVSYSAYYYSTYSASYNQIVYYVPAYAVNESTNYYYASNYSVNYAYPTTYAVRVKVCDPTIGLEADCTQYGSNYKPEGVVQANSQTMRFGVFSYFNSTNTDNAVMRSKAKYVGPMKYSPSSGAISNARTEWSATDGTLVANPDADVASASYPAAVANSGVVNYINQFGSFATSYKTYDDVGKLYYEALKYLRGLQPTAAFYQGATATSADSFPIITTWDDPYVDDPATQTTPYSCRKSYIMLMGDSHTWCDKKLPGGLYASSQDISACNGTGYGPDYGSRAGDSGIDAGASTAVVGTSEGMPSLATTVTGAGGASYYMAGLSFWANSQDVRPDIPGTQNAKTFVLDVEEYKDCGYNSQFWLAAKYGGADSFGASGSGVVANNWSSSLGLAPGACSSRPPSWYSSSANSSGAWPKNLLRAGDPANMISAVQGAMAAISAQNGQVAALAQSSGSLISGGAYLYRAAFSSGGWIGDLNAYAVDVSGNIASAPTWQASQNLPAPSARVIYTFNDGRMADGTVETSDPNARRGVSFVSSAVANLSAREQGFLNQDPLSTVDGKVAARVDYLSGVQSNEIPSGLNWRKRPSVLGDIVDSNPIYVGTPQIPFLPGAGYSSFAVAVQNRTPVVYVGGNDGMLHGFDASPPNTTGHTPGQELMAFVPSATYPRLNQLMWPNYGHQFFVDGSPTVGEACFGSCSGQSDWKTVLTGGLRAGGRGMYALDVTNPSNFASGNAANIVLWEFTSFDDRDLGYTFSNPAIRLMHNNRWAVIFGNGLNSTTPNGAGDPTSTTGRAYVYVLFVDGPGSGNGWGSPCAILASGTSCSTGYNFVKIELRSPLEYNSIPSPAPPLNPPNGVTSVAAVDVDGDHVADYVYAADLQGNVWKIDVTSNDPRNWGTALGSASQPKPLFSATDSASNAQPITSGMQVARHPNGGYLVMFGTGSYDYGSDAYSTGQQSIYGIWDQAGTQPISQTFPVSRARLQIQSRLATVTSGSTTYAVQSNCSPYYGTNSNATTTTAEDGTSTSDPNCPNIVTNPGQQMGWVFDLPNNMERVIMDHPLLLNGVVTFTTMAPANSDPCTGGTSGWRYDLSYLTGGRLPYSLYTQATGNTSPMYVTVTLPGQTQAVTVAPSGQQLVSGASDTPARYTMNQASVTPPGATNPVAIGTTFVPGWGIPSLMSGVSCGLLMDVANGQTNTQTSMCIRGSRGRVSWRALAQ